MPSAGSADSATNAATAGNAAHAPQRGDVLRPGLSYGGLVIEMECASSGGPHGNVEFGRDTTVADAEAVAWGYYNTGAGSNVEDYSAPNDFDPGDPGGLGPGLDGFAGALYGRYEINYVAPSGSVVTATIAVSETTNAFGGTADCIMYCHARQSGRPHNTGRAWPIGVPS